MNENNPFDRAYRILTICAICMAVLLVISLLAGMVTLSKHEPVSAGQSIQFDGRTIDLSGAASAVIQSTSMTQTWSDVTQYTSVVTVTIYLKP